MNINTQLSFIQTTQENTENLQQLPNTSSYPQTGQKRKADDNLQADAKRAKTLSDPD